MHAAARIDVNLALIFIFSLLLNHTHITTHYDDGDRETIRRKPTISCNGGLVPKRDYGSYCIVAARCERLALSSITVLQRRREHGGESVRLSSSQNYSMTCPPFWISSFRPAATTVMSRRSTIATTTRTYRRTYSGHRSPFPFLMAHSF